MQIRIGFEIVYGHAIRPRARARMAPVSTVSLQELRADLTRQRSPH